jgi:hypothetical protein
LIQERAQARNIDSKYRSLGFDNCSLAAQQRVLQHNLPGADIRIVVGTAGFCAGDLR